MSTTRQTCLVDAVRRGEVYPDTSAHIEAKAAGEAMLTFNDFWRRTPYRAWTRRKVDGSWQRCLGQYRGTPQEAAEDLLERLERISREVPA